MDFLKKIKKLEFFKNIPTEELKKITKEVKYTVKIINKDEIIAFRGDKIEDLIIIIKGEVYTEMQKLNGESMIVDRLGKGRVLAGAFIFGKNNLFPVDATAGTKSELLYIPKNEIIRLFQSNETLLRNYLEVISNKTQFLSKKIWFSFANKSINNKLIAYLLNNMDSENKIKLESSIKELAQMFGVARPSLSRVLKELVDSEILIREGKNIFIVKSKEKLLEKVE